MPGGVHTSGLQGAAGAGVGGIHTELMERFAAAGYIYTATETNLPGLGRQSVVALRALSQAGCAVRPPELQS